MIVGFICSFCLQWDEDSAESLSEKSAYSPKRLRLPSPRIHRVSPLKVQKDTKFLRRRKIKRWSPEEENVLREAVKKYVMHLFSLLFKNARSVPSRSCCKGFTLALTFLFNA